jgi:hypothetical protein
VKEEDNAGDEAGKQDRDQYEMKQWIELGMVGEGLRASFHILAPAGALETATLSRQLYNSSTIATRARFHHFR